MTNLSLKYKPGTSLRFVIEDIYNAGGDIKDVSFELYIQEVYIPYDILVGYMDLLTYRKEHPHDNG